jgi:hypothetical protein
VFITTGPYLETREHIGGSRVLEAATLDDALAWGRKAAAVCRALVALPGSSKTEDTRKLDKIR